MVDRHRSGRYMPTMVMSMYIIKLSLIRQSLAVLLWFRQKNIDEIYKLLREKHLKQWSLRLSLSHEFEQEHLLHA